MQLKQFDARHFLSEHWQKKPLLIRNPWTAWANPLEPDELAGLACEEEVESRLILTIGNTWKLEHGPFPERRFEQLGDRPWTLLVQSVDRLVPEVAALLPPFRFLPNWRIDDIMVSYATDGGGVGPHFDKYDVFLVQGLGRRRWRIGPDCDASTALRPHDDLRLLPGFEASDDWVLGPGDILYVPPGVAHEGIAVGHDCMTYSIGFRAPSSSELLAGWSEHLLEPLRDDPRYADPDLEEQRNPGEISAEAIARLHAMATARMLDAAAFGRWFGRYNSSPKHPEMDRAREEPIEVDEVRRLIARSLPLRRSPGSRFSFLRQEDGSVLLFADGASLDCDGETARVAEELCGSDCAHVDPALAGSDAVVTLVAELLNQGSVEFGHAD
ncbi:MAG TPA: cupin domain-containing protein [Allosphingosinicella sp.]|jgi:50S ribosomal protein L16 3-hydroxylase